MKSIILLIIFFAFFRPFIQKQEKDEEQCILHAQQIILNLEKSDLEAVLNNVKSSSYFKNYEISDIKKKYTKLSVFLKEHEPRKIYKFISKDKSLNPKQKNNSVGVLLLEYKYVENKDTIELCELSYFKNLLTNFELTSFISFLDTKKIDASKLPPPKR